MQSKSIDIFLIYVVGASNEYPQHMFLGRNKKNIYLIPNII